MSADSPTTEHLIELLFLGMRARLDRAVRLHATGDGWDREAAMILVCCYLDWTACRLYGREKSKSNFVRLLSDYSPDGRLGLYHPILIARALRGARSHDLQAAGKMLEETVGAGPYELMTETETVGWASSVAGVSSEKMQGVLFKGTLAAAVYDGFRVAAVHGDGALLSFITFSSTTHNGEAVRPIDFELLASTLDASLEGAAEISRRTGLAYGRLHVRGNTSGSYEETP